MECWAGRGQSAQLLSTRAAELTAPYWSRLQGWMLWHHATHGPGSIVHAGTSQLTNTAAGTPKRLCQQWHGRLGGVHVAACRSDSHWWRVVIRIVVHDPRRVACGAI
jgi:hypothetical protein